MTAVAGPITSLMVDAALRRAWSGAAPGPVNGIAGASAGSHGSVIVVSPTPVDGTTIAAATPGLADALGVRSVEIIVITTTALPELVRDWIYQAGQGSGRGVHVTVRTGSTTVRVLVRARDSSARELAFRLASLQEPALPALRALLGGREVSVEDEESLPLT